MAQVDEWLVNGFLVDEWLTWTHGRSLVGEEWLEPRLELELGLGVSRTTGNIVSLASMLGRRLVMTLATAMSEGDQVLGPVWE